MRTIRPSHVLGIRVFAFVIVMVCTTATFAGDTYWQHNPATPGDWFESSNWNPDVPGAGDDAYIDNGGTALIANDSKTANAFRIYVGDNISGDVVQSRGTCLISDTLRLGCESGAVGSYALDGGELSSEYEYVGVHGTGTFTQTGGINTAGYSINIGRLIGSDGTYNLVDGEVYVNAKIFIGEDGQGLFKQSGGQVFLGEGQPGYMYLGWNCVVGVYELEGGDLVIHGGYTAEETLGVYGTGIFKQKGGYHTVKRLMMGSNWGARGEYYLSGGILDLETFILGRVGTGEFVQTGGTNTISSWAHFGTEGGSGTYTISAGNLSVQAMGLGADDGQGTLKVIGADANISIGTYNQGDNGSLVSELDDEGISKIVVSGTADLDGTWIVLDDGAPFDKFDILTASGGIFVKFDMVNLPGPDWTWGVEGGTTLWVEHVPEPATMSLLAIGGLALIRRRRK